MKQTAIKAAKEAGKVMLKYYGKKKNISFKENHKSIVTSADIECEKLIKRIIKKKYPKHNFLGEESGREKNDSEYTWIIDPIDGTSNFSQDFAYFCVSIGLKRNDKIILGVIYNPTNKELFFAEKGKGAYLNNKRINVSKKTRLRDAMASIAIPSSSEISIDSLKKTIRIFKKIRGIRLTGSAALNMCNVACGRFDVWVSQSIKPWDVAAGYIIVKEAGGKVTDSKFNEWKVDQEMIIASNRKIHNIFIKSFFRK